MGCHVTLDRCVFLPCDCDFSWAHEYQDACIDRLEVFIKCGHSSQSERPKFTLACSEEDSQVEDDAQFDATGFAHSVKTQEQ